MDGASVPDEVRSGERVPREEFIGQHVALHPVTRSTGGDEVSGGMCPTPCYRMDVVERRFHRLEVVAAVDTSPATVAHRRPLEGTLVIPVEPGDARKGLAAVPVTPS